MWSGSVLKLVGGMDDVILPFPPTLRGTVGTPSRAAFFTPKQSHENERTRYLYITRNPRYFKRLTFPQNQNQFEKFHVNLFGRKEKWDMQKLEVALVHTTVSQSLSRFETKKI